MENPLVAEADAETHAISEVGQILLDHITSLPTRSLVPVRFDAALAEVEIPFVPTPYSQLRGPSLGQGRISSRDRELDALTERLLPCNDRSLPQRPYNVSPFPQLPYNDRPLPQSPYLDLCQNFSHVIYTSLKHEHVLGPNKILPTCTDTSPVSTEINNKHKKTDFSNKIVAQHKDTSINPIQIHHELLESPSINHLIKYEALQQAVCFQNRSIPPINGIENNITHFQDLLWQPTFENQHLKNDGHFNASVKSVIKIIKNLNLINSEYSDEIIIRDKNLIKHNLTKVNQCQTSESFCSQLCKIEQHVQVRDNSKPIAITTNANNRNVNQNESINNPNMSPPSFQNEFILKSHTPIPKHEEHVIPQHVNNSNGGNPTDLPSYQYPTMLQGGYSVSEHPWTPTTNISENGRFLPHSVLSVPLEEQGNREFDPTKQSLSISNDINAKPTQLQRLKQTTVPKEIHDEIQILFQNEKMLLVRIKELVEKQPESSFHLVKGMANLIERVDRFIILEIAQWREQSNTIKKELFQSSNFLVELMERVLILLVGIRTPFLNFYISIQQNYKEDAQLFMNKIESLHTTDSSTLSSSGYN